MSKRSLAVRLKRFPVQKSFWQQLQVSNRASLVPHSAE